MRKTLGIILFSLLISCNSTRYSKNVDVEIDSVELHDIQSDNIAQINPYFKAHMINSNTWISVSNLDTSSLQHFYFEDTEYIVKFIYKAH